jgi:Gluconate 2-dehydrogenase subunit 3
MDSRDNDLTRRNLLLVALAAGFGNKSQAGTNTPAELPPGLYEPSSNHLEHALASTTPFHVIPPGCPTDYIRPASGPFKPLFFSEADFAIIRRLVELLLDDESAAQEVAAWIDLQVSSAAGVREAALHVDPLHRALAIAYLGSSHVIEVETSDPATICREGLEWIANTAEGFLSLDREHQLALLRSIETRSETPGTQFFDFLKTEVIRGFYTSQAGLKELDFKGNAFYARSPGCDSR